MEDRFNFLVVLAQAALSAPDMVPFPDPREDPKSRSLNGGSYKVP